jgi:hypothetical protein
MAKDILFGTEAQSLIKEGVDKLANAVKATLDLDRANPFPIARSPHFLENIIYLKPRFTRNERCQKTTVI